MANQRFQRARSSEAKAQRGADILAAARVIGEQHGIRRVTLTDIADAVGMHKSALLRYFETREQIFLRLTAEGWREWGPALRAELDDLDGTDSPGAGAPGSVARVVAHSLAIRPLFCDLLAQAPLNLERNVSLDSVLAFKLVTLEEVDGISTSLRRILPELTESDAVDVIAAATSLSGAFWQMATPGATVENLYREDPRLVHAVVEVEPRVTRILTAQLTGLTGH
ncbi:TetR/AcrR family transcriptional regulator [Herbiconiux solani]|uniref:TetR/AcrR family transcriptional regulator n=1 Tax=Herbiconiux solani TaxID=661329 RepID=UPI000824916F|nr:TetR family transcriptional regulator [Herbiconiux solani]